MSLTRLLWSSILLASMAYSQNLRSTESDLKSDVRDAGFTKILPSKDSRLIYVSSSTGNDNNHCLSPAKACSSIAKGIRKMRSGYPDHLYLKSGDVWFGQNFTDLPSGRSESEPAVVSYYGGKERPRLNSETYVYRQVRSPRSHIHIIGLHISSYLRDPGNPSFNPGSGLANMRFIGPFDDVLLEDNVFDNAGVTIESYKGRPSNIVIRRNIFNGIYSNQSSYSQSGRSAAIYTAKVDGQLIEENVFDYSGWHPHIKGAGANKLSHAVYMQVGSDGNKTFFRNNIVVRAASHGIQLRSGGVAENNFFARNAIGLTMGYHEPGKEIPKGTVAHALNNVVTEGHSMFKGVDACSKKHLCTRALWGINMLVYSDADFRAYGNIASRLYDEGDGKMHTRGLPFSFKNGRSDFPHGNNISYAWSEREEGKSCQYMDPDRGLSEYYSFLNKSEARSPASPDEGFNAFMQIVKARSAGVWDEKYTAAAINSFIRKGFVRKGSLPCK